MRFSKAAVTAALALMVSATSAFVPASSLQSNRASFGLARVSPLQPSKPLFSTAEAAKETFEFTVRRIDAGRVRLSSHRIV
jgi:hypothetical protein